MGSNVYPSKKKMVDICSFWVLPTLKYIIINSYICFIKSTAFENYST